MSVSILSSSVRGYTVADLAARYRVSADKVRTWIKRGELSAINTADRRSARPRFVITTEAIAAFEQRHAAAMPEAPKPKRRQRQGRPTFYPD